MGLKWLTPELVQGACLGLLTILSAIGWVGTFIKNHKEKNNKDSQNVSKTIEKQCLIDGDIIDRMENVKEFYNADRVHFYDFHNGVHYSNGRSAKKFSCTYEKVRFGIEPVKRIMKDIETSDVPVFLNKLFSECKFEIANIEDIKDTMDTTYLYMKKAGVKSCYVMAVKNQSKEPIGFIMLQYVNNTMPKMGRLEDLEYLQKFKWFMEEKLREMI